MAAGAQLFQYRMALALLRPLLSGYTLWQGFKTGGRRYLAERHGYYRARGGERPLWIHAASVGEVNAALPLVEALRSRHPGVPLLITTVTPTGANAARQKLPGEVEHAYLPIDWGRADERFLDTFRPRAALILETELWPNLYSACGERSLPLIIVNGRLSPRTVKAPVWVRDLYAGALGEVTAILARSERDRQGFLQLGAAAPLVEVIGNIKFAALGRATVAPLSLGRPYVLAASTRDGEERLVVEAWLAEARGGHLLVLAPRHPGRLPAILKDLSRFRAAVAIRSRSEAITPETAIYVADTFGELEGFMAGAELVFMGGSLVPKGGHNVLEAARSGKALLFGPHMENFLDESELLLAAGAACQVANQAELAVVFGRLLADPEWRAHMGESGRRVVEERRDMAERYVAAMERHIDLNRDSPLGS